MSEYYVYFSRPNDTIENQPPLGPICYGPFQEFIQITYSELRSGPNGDPLAYLQNDIWRVVGDRSETDPDYWFSDVVISTEGDLR